VPRPLLTLDAAVGQKPRSGQLVQPGADAVDIEPTYRTEQVLAERPTRHGQRHEDRFGRSAAATSPRYQLLGQPHRQRDAGTRHSGQRAGHCRHELLGEERVAFGSRVQLVDHSRRHSGPRQLGNLLAHLGARELVSPGLRAGHHEPPERRLGPGLGARAG